jgi:2,3-bisphosphoglycerate-independent phosphoglycerate mutase
LQRPQPELPQANKEHRFLVVFRGAGLSENVADTDPHAVGLSPLDPEPADDDAAKTARLAKEFVDKAREKLAGREPANMVLLRGFAQLRELNSDVLVVTGDHSTPWKLVNHGWQPVPLLINSAYCRLDEVRSFGERACIAGGLGPRLRGSSLMPIAMANAIRLDKFGA